MSTGYRDLRKLWPLVLLAISVLIVGYSGFWPAFPLAGKRFTTNRGQRDPVSDRILVEWLAKLDLPSPNELTKSGSDIRLNASHYLIYGLDAAKEAELDNRVSRPQICQVGQSLFCVWQVHEQASTSDNVAIYGAWSADGQQWSAPQLVFPPTNEPAPEQRLRSAPFATVNGEIFAVAAVYQVVGYGSSDATTFSEPKSAGPTAEFPTPVYEMAGYYLRRVLREQTLGPPFELFRRSGEAYSVAEAMRGVEIVDQALIPDLVRLLATPDSRFGGKMEFVTPELETEDRYNLSRPTEVQLPNNRRLRLWSSEQGLDRLYCQNSRDGGLTWDKPAPTNLRNSGAFAVIGTLPSPASVAAPAPVGVGPVFLIGNQIRNGNVVADPLTVSIAFEDLQFTECFLLRYGAPSPTRKLEQLKPRDMAEHLGFQVNSYLIRDDDLWVAYAVNGEAIEISKVRCRNLAPALDTSAAAP